MSIIGALIIGALAGFLAGRIMKGRGFGVFGNILVGIVGAFVGSFVFGLAGLAATSVVGKLIMATVGAVVLLALVGMIRRP